MEAPCSICRKTQCVFHQFSGWTRKVVGLAPTFVAVLVAACLFSLQPMLSRIVSIFFTHRCWTCLSAPLLFCLPTLTIIITTSNNNEQLQVWCDCFFFPLFFGAISNPTPPSHSHSHLIPYTLLLLFFCVRLTLHCWPQHGSLPSPNIHAVCIRRLLNFHSSFEGESHFPSSFDLFLVHTRT